MTLSIQRSFVLLSILGFLLSSCNSESEYIPEQEETIIAIQPLSLNDYWIADTLKLAIENYYGIKTYVLPGKPVPNSAFVHIKSPRYRADSIIKILRREKADTIDFVVGITSKDISTTKRMGDRSIKKPESKYKDWGIFGLGFRPGPSCVVSAFRLKKGAGKKKFRTRLKKVALHELGHNFGLPHCSFNEHCIMRDANETIKTIDKEGMVLCGSCKAKIGM